MQLSDPRAAAFSEDKFRDAIRFVMQMGAPETEEERATFVWNAEKTYNIADPAGRPYEWNTTPETVVTHEPVQATCSVEFTPRKSASTGTPVGDIDESRAKITLLDEDYETVIGADQVILGLNTYNITLVAPPEGLFGVTTYTLYAEAIDES